MTRGQFITFEGIDGAGKSSHIAFVTQWVKDQGKDVVVTREPGGTPLGETLRELLLNHDMHLETEALLMFAARREHIDKVIEPALSAGKWVISDRFTDASWAYQGGGRGLATDKLDALEQWVHPHLQPDLTFLFDVPPEVAAARLSATRNLDRFEREQQAFFERVRAAYAQRAKQYSDRFCMIDSSQSMETIQTQIRQILESRCLMNA